MERPRASDMDKTETDTDKICGREVYRRAALRGALWTSPVWASILESALATASPRFDAFALVWPDFFSTALYILFLFGSSLCLLPGLWLTGGPLGFADAAKKGLSSALAVAAAYLLFAFASLFSADPGGPAWGGAFGLLSAAGSLTAALMGAFAKLGWQYLVKTVLNPYKEPPARQ